MYLIEKAFYLQRVGQGVPIFLNLQVPLGLDYIWEYYISSFITHRSKLVDQWIQKIWPRSAKLTLRDPYFDLTEIIGSLIRCHCRKYI